MAFLYGTNGGNVRTGTADNDFIYGWSATGDATTDTGNDTLNGLGGSDTSMVTAVMTRSMGQRRGIRW